MTTKARTSFAFAVALACVALVPAAALAQNRVVRSAQLDRDGEFRIWNLVGSVRVVGWDRDSVQVEGDFDDVALGAFVFGAQGEGGKLGTADEGRSGVAHLVVRLPHGATVWIKTMSAPVEVSGMTGSIDVYAVTGDVRIDGSATTIYAESMGGRVHVTGNARVVRLRTGSGAITFDGSAPDLVLNSVSGDVLARASGLVRGIVETVGGRVHLGVSFGRPASLEVMTHDGEIDLTLPVRAPVDYRISTVSGGIRVLDPLRRGRRARDGTIVTDRDAADVPYSVRGGAAVELRTFSGDITLRGAP